MRETKFVKTKETFLVLFKRAIFLDSLGRIEVGVFTKEDCSIVLSEDHSILFKDLPKDEVPSKDRIEKVIETAKRWRKDYPEEFI